MPASLPDYESGRLEALYRYHVLDTPAEPSFDRLTRLAGQLFCAPMCAVAFLDKHRLFLKSAYGVDVLKVTGTPRDLTFSHYAIESSDVTIVPDALQDPRFAESPLVTGAGGVRFFAGAPLETPDGLRIGTLCVLDNKPRHVSAEQISILKLLAAEVMELLEFHQARRQLALVRDQLAAQTLALEESRKLWGRTEQRVTLALEAGHMGYWERDAKTDLITFSPTVAAMIGLDQATYDGSVKEWLKKVHPDDRATILETIRQANLTNETYTLKYRVVTVDGSERWITSRGTYRADAAGNFSGAQGVSWDSTASEKVARELKMNEEIFRGLSASVPVGVFRSDVAANIIYANPKAAAIFGTTEEQMLGAGWQKYVHPDDLDDLKASIRESNKSGNFWDCEYRLLLPHGEVRWVHARGSMMRDASGAIIGKIGTFDDITQRHQTMHELQEAKEAAEVASRAKDVFLANVSHELRTPLNGVLGITDLLMDSRLNRDQLEFAEIIRESGQSLLRVVNDVLDISRIEADRVSIERAPFSLRVVIHQTMALLEAEARRKDLDLVTLYPGDLPSWYLGDSTRIKQILVNYLSNAIKFTPSGQISLTVRSMDSAESVKGDSVELLISVADQGSGIEQDAQRKLFMPFSQVDGSASRRNGGVGLGLAISKRLAELMGGSVGVTSSLGKGSIFWLRLRLPIHAQPVPQTAAVSNEPAKTGRVLLVEDNAVNQRVAAGALRRLGWEADVAGSGLVALDLFERNDYSIIFMDCQMPEMDGYEATRKIRKLESTKGHPGIPVVALTAHAMTGDRERCLEAGMNDYLTKPFGIEELKTALERWATVHA